MASSSYKSLQIQIEGSQGFSLWRGTNEHGIQGEDSVICTISPSLDCAKCTGSSWRIQLATSRVNQFDTQSDSVGFCFVWPIERFAEQCGNEFRCILIQKLSTAASLFDFWRDTKLMGWKHGRKGSNTESSESTGITCWSKPLNHFKFLCSTHDGDGCNDLCTVCTCFSGAVLSRSSQWEQKSQPHRASSQPLLRLQGSKTKSNWVDTKEPQHVEDKRPSHHRSDSFCLFLECSMGHQDPFPSKSYGRQVWSPWWLKGHPLYF